MNTQVSKQLLDLKAEFDLWRQSRTSIRTPIPDHLWQKAAALLNTHSLSTICSFCGLHPDRLKKWAALLANKPVATTHSNNQQKHILHNDFFHLPSPPPDQSLTVAQLPLPSSITLLIERADGSRLSLSLPSTR
jgi:hypothetical protein